MRCILALLAGLLCSSALANRPLALVTDVQGAVTQAGKPVALASSLAEGAGAIVVAKDARLVALLLASNQEFEIAGPARVEFTGAGISSLEGSKPVLRGQFGNAANARHKIAPGAVAQAALVMRGSQPITLLEPAGARLLNRPATFRWRPVNVARYRFRITDTEGATLYERQVDKPELELPAEVALLPGKTYQWDVSAASSSGPRYAGTKTLALAEEDLLKAAAELRPADGAEVSRLVAFSVWLEQHGFADEAQKYWKAVSAQRPK